MSNKEVKKKLCAEKKCSNYFVPYKTTDKYCSYKCSQKNHKPLKRTPLKPSFCKPKQKAKILSYKKSVKNDFEKEFDKSKKIVKKRVQKQYGELCCERCKTKHSIQFSVHHIIYRSEKPKHPSLNHPLNLMYLCYNCHEWFHQKKDRRNYIISKRNLVEFFERIWGYDPDIEY